MKAAVRRSNVRAMAAMGSQRRFMEAKCVWYSVLIWGGNSEGFYKGMGAGAAVRMEW